MGACLVITPERKRSGAPGGDAVDAAAMSFADIAKALNTTESAVEYHYKVAMKKLRLYPVLIGELRAMVEDLATARRERAPVAASAGRRPPAE
jgi:hypothetical protein